MISFFAFSGLLNFITSFLLGILIYLKGKKEFQSRSFVLYFFSIAFWNFGYYFWQISTEESLALFWSRVLMAGAIFIPIFYFHLIISFLNLFEKYKKALYWGYSLTFLFLLLDFTPYFVKGVEKRLIFPFWPEPGIFYHPFLLMFAAFICYGWYSLIKVLRKTTEKIKKQQIKYLLLGTGIGTIGGSTNYFLWYGIPVLPYGNILVIFGVLLVAFAILKYHLFEIKVILTELLVGVIGLLLLVQAMTAENFTWQIFGLGLFVLFCVFGYLLIKSVILEIQRRQEIEKIDKAKSEFISIASHQLRTPLTAVKGYISMILEGTYGQLAEKQARPLENVYKSNERLIKLVNDLLSVSRIESGKLKLEPQKTSIEEIISNVVEELKIEAKKKNIYLNWEKPHKPLPKILIDIDKTKQIILNIVDNAIKYTKQGGVTVSTKIQDSRLKIQVKDTGEGMTEKEISYLFESFSRGKAGTHLYSEGAGLGLYIARKFVEMHQGKIWAESKGKDKGSTFYIELPIK